MKSIAVNLLSGAATEYRRDVQSITSRYAGSHAGLFALEGESDAGKTIEAEVRTPVSSQGSTLQKCMQTMYVAGDQIAAAQALVLTPKQQWSYPVRFGHAGVGRADLGRGIREVYLGFGLQFPSGEAFSVDRIEVVLAQSKNRRVS